MSVHIETRKVLTGEDRRDAMEVIDEVFRREKSWLRDVDGEIPADPAAVENRSYFLVEADGEPAGLIRLAYDPPLELPPELEVELDPGVDLDELAAGKRFVEIGRFMIKPSHRRNFRVALRLIRAAMEEVVDRRYTHFLTDVYDGDPHSPLGFHTRVLGFERIGTHRYGDLDAKYRRIILVLDIVRSYRRQLASRNRVFREVISGLEARFEALAAASARA